MIEQIFSLKQNKEIELAVASLSFNESRALLQFLHEMKTQEKVSPIIAGLTAENFINLLIDRPPLLKKWAHLEVLQHKLILLATDIGKDLALKANVLLEQEKLIRTLSPNLLCEQSHKTLRQLDQAVHHIESIVHALIELAWISARPDFIELCNQVKEHLVHLQLYLEALKKSLKERLNSFFSSIDSTNAIEGLASMGLIYQEDWKNLFQKLGVSGSFKSEHDFIQGIEKILKKSGIHTVKDLKEKELYTVELLVQYLKPEDGGLLRQES